MSACPEPQHPILADLLCRLDECQREAYEERAGILTFEAGVDRPLAEALALLDLIRIKADGLVRHHRPADRTGWRQRMAADHRPAVCPPARC